MASRADVNDPRWEARPDTLRAPAPQSTARTVSHQPLQTNEIRLVDFGAGPGEPVLLHVSVENPPEFIAISYCWGPDNCLHPFELNDQILVLTSSLYLIFEEIKRQGLRRRVWADAICINQRDADEKSVQIPLMQSIYGKAQQVAIWLGHCNEDILTEYRIQQVTSYAFFEQQTSFDSLTDFLDHLARFSLPNLDDLFWVELMALFCRPWLDRLWVMPEAILAREPVTWSGHLCIPWTAFIGLLQQLYVLRSSTPDGSTVYHFSGPGNWSFIAVCDSWIQLNIFRRDAEHGNSALELLARGRIKKSSLPQDKVYALLSMMPSWFQQSVHVDVTASPQNVYIRAAKALASVAICELLAQVESVSRIKGIPSWVPDWGSRGCENICYAAGEISLQEYCDPNLDSSGVILDDTVLRLDGQHIDSVASIEPSHQDIPRILGTTEADGLEAPAKFISWGTHCFKHVVATWCNSDIKMIRHLCEVRQDKLRDAVGRTLQGRGSHLGVVTAEDIGRYVDVDCHPWPDDVGLNREAICHELSQIDLYEPRRTFFLTENYNMGLGPLDLEPNDGIIFLHNPYQGDDRGVITLAIRPRPGKGTFQALGVCSLYKGPFRDLLGSLPIEHDEDWLKVREYAFD